MTDLAPRRMEPSMKPEPPQNPIGPFTPAVDFGPEYRSRCINDLSALPGQLREAVSELSGQELNTKYRNWTIRQIVHHIADSHVNSYVRFKWALTEDSPIIKAYDEGLWSQLTESATGDIVPSLQLLDGLHARWVQLLNSMSDTDFGRTFLHSESGETIALNSALDYYPWHGKHHTGQILWLREAYGL